MQKYILLTIGYHAYFIPGHGALAQGDHGPTGMKFGTTFRDRWSALSHHDGLGYRNRETVRTCGAAAMTRIDNNSRHDPLVRIRLTEWARREGIARITAYRMLRRGILPVVSERSPTGRWYVYVPSNRVGRTVVYVRAAPGPAQVASLNRQVESLSKWAGNKNRSNFAVVREIANPYTDNLPKFEALVADPYVTEIVIDHPWVVGEFQFRLLVAALASQGRTLSVANGTRHQSRDQKVYLQGGIERLCVHLHGRELGLEAARYAIAPPGSEPAGDLRGRKPRTAGVPGK